MLRCREQQDLLTQKHTKKVSPGWKMAFKNVQIFAQVERFRITWAEQAVITGTFYKYGKSQKWKTTYELHNALNIDKSLCSAILIACRVKNIKLPLQRNGHLKSTCVVINVIFTTTQNFTLHWYRLLIHSHDLITEHIYLGWLLPALANWFQKNPKI